MTDMPKPVKKPSIYGRKIMYFRDLRGFSQEDVAERTKGKVKQQTIAQLESGEVQSCRQIGAIADALGVFVEELETEMVLSDEDRKLRRTFNRFLLNATPEQKRMARKFLDADDDCADIPIRQPAVNGD